MFCNSTKQKSCQTTLSITFVICRKSGLPLHKKYAECLCGIIRFDGLFVFNNFKSWQLSCCKKKKTYLEAFDKKNNYNIIIIHVMYIL